MSKFRILSILLVVLFGSNDLFGNTIYWVGDVNSSMTNPYNWSSNSTVKITVSTINQTDDLVIDQAYFQSRRIYWPEFYDKDLTVASLSIRGNGATLELVYNDLTIRRASGTAPAVFIGDGATIDVSFLGANDSLVVECGSASQGIYIDTGSNLNAGNFNVNTIGNVYIKTASGNGLKISSGIANIESKFKIDCLNSSNHLQEAILIENLSVLNITSTALINIIKPVNNAIRVKAGGIFLSTGGSLIINGLNTGANYAAIYNEGFFSTLNTSSITVQDVTGFSARGIVNVGSMLLSGSSNITLNFAGNNQKGVTNFSTFIMDNQSVVAIQSAINVDLDSFEAIGNTGSIELRGNSSINANIPSNGNTNTVGLSNNANATLKLKSAARLDLRLAGNTATQWVLNNTGCRVELEGTSVVAINSVGTAGLNPNIGLLNRGVLEIGASAAVEIGSSTNTYPLFSNGLKNELYGTVNNHGRISIFRGGGYNLFNEANSTFNNHGSLFISVSFTNASGGIKNVGRFVNHYDPLSNKGLIQIQGAGNVIKDGIHNEANNGQPNLFLNQDSIEITLTANSNTFTSDEYAVKNYAGGIFLNDNNGRIALKQFTQKGLRNESSFTNRGEIWVFNNGATISLGDAAFENATSLGEFENYGEIYIGTGNGSSTTPFLRNGLTNSGTARFKNMDSGLLVVLGVKNGGWGVKNQTGGLMQLKGLTLIGALISSSEIPAIGLVNTDVGSRVDILGNGVVKLGGDSLGFQLKIGSAVRNENLAEFLIDSAVLVVSPRTLGIGITNNHAKFTVSNRPSSPHLSTTYNLTVGNCPNTNCASLVSSASSTTNSLGVFFKDCANIYLEGEITNASNGFVENDAMLKLKASSLNFTNTNTSLLNSGLIWDINGNLGNQVGFANHGFYYKQITPHSLAYQNANAIPVFMDNTLSAAPTNILSVSPVPFSSGSYHWPSNQWQLASAISLPAGTSQMVSLKNQSSSNACANSIPFPYTFNVLPAPSITANGPNIGLYPGAQLAVTVTGTTGPYTYHWSLPNGSTTTVTSTNANSSFSPTSAGNYSVSVTSPNCAGCNIVATFVVLSPPSVTLTSNTPNPLCSGGAMLITAAAVPGSGSLTSYAWSLDGSSVVGVGGQLSFSGPQTQSWSGVKAIGVTVTDSNGLTASSTYSLTVTETPVISSIADMVLCAGNNLVVPSTVVPAIGTSYNWAGNAIFSTNDSLIITPVSALNEGVVTLTAARGGCSSQESFYLDVLPLPNATVTSNQTSFCMGDNAILTAQAGYASYVWNGPGTMTTGVNDHFLTFGTIAFSDNLYSVTVTDINGCSAASPSYTITLRYNPSFTQTTTTDVTCPGGANGSASTRLSGGNPPYTWVWSNGQTGFSSGGGFATASITGLTSGQYTLTVVNSYGCSVTRDFMVNTTNPPLFFSLGTNATNPSCNGGANGSIYTVAGGGASSLNYSFLWNNGHTGSFRTGLSSGSYTITLTDNAGCQQDSTFVLTAPAALEISLMGAVQASCYGANNGSLSINVAGGVQPYSYRWGNGMTTQNSSGLATGNHSVTVTDANSCTATLTAFVGTASPLTASINITSSPSCNSSTNASAQAIPGGGTPGYRYLWSNGRTTQTVTGLGAGAISLTITDASGCSISASNTIVAPPALTLVTQIVPETCNESDNGAINTSVAGGSQPYTYRWSNGHTTAQLSGLSANNFSLTVTDVLGCSTSATNLVIPVPTLPNIQISPASPAFCAGSNVGLNATAGHQQYRWSGPFGFSQISSSPMATVGITGVYSVTITTFAGCTASATATVTSLSSPIVSQTVTNVSCHGGSNGSVMLSTSGSGLVYRWSNGSTYPSITGLTVGGYQVTVTSAQGCNTMLSFNITAPNALSVLVNSNDVTCHGRNNGIANAFVVGGTLPYSYNWGGGRTASTATGLAPGFYVVTVTDSKGCTVTGSALIQSPTAISFNSQIVNETCPGRLDGLANIIAYGGTPAYTYLWSNGSSSASINNLAGGNYTVTITDANQCAVTTTLSIGQGTAPSVSISPANPIACWGGSVWLSATGAASNYLWSGPGGFNSTQPVVNVAATGSYQLTITDANGCTAMASANVSVNTQPTANELITHNNCFGGATGSITIQSVTGLSGALSYIWNNGATGSALAGLPAGNYSVTITAPNGCNLIKSFSVIQPSGFPLAVSIANSTTTNPCVAPSLQAIVSGGGGGYSYSWNGSAFSFSTAIWPNPNVGVNTLSVRDVNSCVVSSNIIVQPFSAISATATGVDVTCFNGSNGFANVNARGGMPPYVYSWSSTPAQNTQMATGLSPGIYRATVSDANGCTAITNNVTITNANPITTSITPSTPLICANSGGVILTSTTSGIDYQWSVPVFGGGRTILHTITPSYNALLAGDYFVTVTTSNGCTTNANTFVTLAAQPAVGFVTTMTSCPSLSNGRIIAAASLGVSPYQFRWSNGATTAFINSVGAGSYTLTVTDANGCTNSNSTILGSQPGPSVALIPSHLTCFGNVTGSISTTVTGGLSPYQFVWSNAMTTPSPSGLMAGGYSLTLTDATGCSVTRAATVSEPPVLQVSINAPAIVCKGSPLVALAQTSGGTGAYSYSWAGTSIIQGNTSVINDYPVSSTVLMATVTDINGCSVTDSRTVQVVDIQLNEAVVDAGCLGANNGSISLTPTGGVNNAYNYVWGNGDTNSSLTGLAVGLYNVTVENVGSGCLLSRSFYVGQADILTMGVDSVLAVRCFGDSTGAAFISVFGGTTPYQYLWSNGLTTEDIANQPAGNYSITITDLSGCLAIASLNISTPSPLNIITSSTATGCAGINDGSASSFITGGVAPYSYVWSSSPTQTTAVATGLSSGMYFLTASDANGCTIASQTLVSESAQIQPFILSSQGAVCPGNRATLNAYVTGGGTSPFIYNWSNGFVGFVQDVTISSDTIFRLTVTDVNGCVGEQQVQIGVHALPIIDAGPDVSVCSGDTLRLDANFLPGATYQWILSGGGVSWGQQVNMLNPLTGENILILTDANGCVATDTVHVQVNQSLSQLNMISQGAVCFGSDIMLICNDIPGAIYTWTYPTDFAGQVLASTSTGSTSEFTIPRAATPGNQYYYVRVTSPNCGSRVDSVMVRTVYFPAPVMASSSVTVCEGEELRLQANPIPSAFFNWLHPLGIPFANQNPLVLRESELSDAGLYRIYYLKNSLGLTCASDTSNVLVTINASVDTTGVFPRMARGVCVDQNDSLELTANWPSTTTLRNFQYIWTTPSGTELTFWTPDSTNLKLPAPLAGIYRLKIMNLTTGCLSEEMEVEVELSRRPTNIRPQLNPPVVCEGNDLEIDVFSSSNIANATFRWFYPNATQPIIGYGPSHTISDIEIGDIGYYDLVVAVGSCVSDTASFRVQVVNKPTVETRLDTFYLENLVRSNLGIGANSDASVYSWSTPFESSFTKYIEGDFIGTMIQLYPTQEHDTVVYVLKGENTAYGCADYDTCVVVVLPLRVGPDASLVVYDLMTPNGDGVNETFFIEGIQNLSDYTIQVFDRRGMEVFRTENYDNSWAGDIGGKALPDGAYWYLIKTPVQEVKGALTILR